MTALTDGIPELEGIHTWTPGDGGSALTMNRLRVLATGAVLLPRIAFDTMEGFRALPDAQDNREDRVARVGETPLPGVARGKTFTVEGRMQALTLQAVKQLRWSMLTAFGERDIEGTWSALHQTTVADVTGDDTEFWQSTARVLDFRPDGAFVKKSTDAAGYELGFALVMRHSDPRWSWNQAASASHASSAACTNQGNAPAEPTITITGASGTVTVTNTTIDKQLVFQSLPAGTLVVDFARRTALIGAADASPYLDAYESDWWDRGVPGLRPGANTITLTGGTNISVAWRHAAW